MSKDEMHAIIGDKSSLEQRRMKDKCSHMEFSVWNKIPNSWGDGYCFGWTYWLVFEEGKEERHTSNKLLCPGGDSEFWESNECINAQGGRCCVRMLIEVRFVNGKTLHGDYKVKPGYCYTGDELVIAPKKTVKAGAVSVEELIQITSKNA